MKRTLVVGLVLAVGLVCGCRRSETVTAPDGTKATFSKSGKNVSVTNPDGTRTTVTQSGKNYEVKVEGKDGGTVQIAASEAGVALPDGFPKDAPVYPGAKVLSSMKAPEGMYVVLQTSDAKDKVSAFYKEKLKANGWEIKDATDTPQGTMLIGDKGGISLTTSIAAGEPTTTVTLIVGQKK